MWNIYSPVRNVSVDPQTASARMDMVAVTHVLNQLCKEGFINPQELDMLNGHTELNGAFASQFPGNLGVVAGKQGANHTLTNHKPADAFVRQWIW